MRYIFTIIWALLVSLAVTYVLSSMAAQPFVMTEALILAAIFAVVVILMGDGVLKGEED